VEESGPSRPRVLVVDDDAPVARALRRELTSEFEVLVALGPEPAAAALAGAPDLAAVITDLVMNGPRGLEVLREAVERVPGCARILLSGTPDAPEVQRALDAGLAHGFVAKPWTPGEIRATVRSAITRSRSAR
jgi:CheY-like chemotaxis protein